MDIQWSLVLFTAIASCGTWVSVGVAVDELRGLTQRTNLTASALALVLALVLSLAACGAPVFLPQPNTPERLMMQLGPFTVECSRFPHIPVPGMAEAPHAVYWISAAGKSIYVTADAQIDTERHRAILHGRRADAAFWNGQYLSHPETRELLLEAAVKNYIYHIPVDEKDVCGIRRKCERSMARFGAELPNVSLLEQYPSSLEA